MGPDRRSATVADAAAMATLGAVALALTLDPRRRRLLTTADGPLDFSVALTTDDGSVAVTFRVRGGRARVRRGVARDADAVITARDGSTLADLVRLPPNEVLTLLMKGRLVIRGNLTWVSAFNHLTSRLGQGRNRSALARAREDFATEARTLAATAGNGDGSPSPWAETTGAGAERRARPADLLVGPGPAERRADPRADRVEWLDDPYLSDLRLDDFPRLVDFLDQHFTTRPEICPERPLLLTRWYRRHGFELRPDGTPWNPVLRQAGALAHLMSSKEARVRSGDLLAGTTTTRDIGVVLYPDAHGTLIWGELLTVADRTLNPYDVDAETVEALHDVFPFWADRSFREWVRDTYAAPRCQEIDERFAAYFLWKTVALSHTIPDFPRLLRLGVEGVVGEIDDVLAGEVHPDVRDQLMAMRISLESVVAYSQNLARTCRQLAAECTDATRRAELEHMADVCDRVPRHPAATLDEAVQATWTAWIAQHMENTNAGHSLGRMDQWLQPYFAADMARIDDPEERRTYVRHAVELLGCFYLRCTDHLPLIPDIGNFLFGGSSSGQAITLGGVARDGGTGVVDMTYVLLKVTELLRLRDPNVNARFSREHNSDAYLTRLCEVNLLTTATPSIHGDEAVMRSIEGLGYSPEDRRDWAATGCVEPTIIGRHIGHTNCMMFNLVAPLELALHDGWHPLMQWQVGARTGNPATGAHRGFEDFFDAYITQLELMAEQATDYNHMLGEAHAVLRPTPLLSAMIDGPVESGRDVTQGGARYNTSGVACIGLTDVIDSLMAIKHLVYDEGRVDFADLLEALRVDFVGHEALAARIASRVPQFGSGDEEALAMANRLTKLIHDVFSARRNFRGGPYTTGFWSMSNHVAFGTLTGALPSGRRAGRAFTPGLTPAATASPNLLDNLRDVAALDPVNMDNNVAFNVKYVPSARDSHARSVEQMAAYTRAYFEMGGMQMQLNVVSTEVLRDAMVNPDQHRDLLVRISGYNAYFVTLNHDMQVELIERAEFDS
jgi:formate C-acetyltransferase